MSKGLDARHLTGQQIHPGLPSSAYASLSSPSVNIETNDVIRSATRQVTARLGLGSSSNRGSGFVEINLANLSEHPVGASRSS